MRVQAAVLAATLPGDRQQPERESAAGRVLIVDDDRLVRWAVAETLGAKGYEVVEAPDAASARRALALGLRLDVVLLDLWLPDSDDLSLARLIRARSPDTAIVLMTASATPEVCRQAADLGMATVMKPFDMSELSAIVGRARASHRLAHAGSDDSRCR